MNIEISSTGTLTDPEIDKEETSSSVNNSSNSLKRHIENLIIDKTKKKKLHFIEQDTQLAKGMIVVHVAFKTYDLSRMLNVQTSNLINFVKDLEIAFQTIKNELIKDAEEIDKENSQNLNETSRHCSQSIVSEGEAPRHLSEKSDTKFNRNENNATQCSETDIAFKLPPSTTSNNTLQSKELYIKHQLMKNRVSSSTSTSSVPASVSSKSRFSTSSISTQSDGSVDIFSKEKRDSIVISETSESSMEKYEPLIIPSSDDDIEATEVYARWKTEKYFYSGVVKGHIFLSDVQVYFDDSTIETIKSTDILFRDRLPIGTEVLVDLENSGSFVKNFIILDHVDISKFKSKPKKGYSVLCETNDEKYRVSRDCVSVHIDVVRKIMIRDESLNSSVSDYHNLSSSNISLDNILHGKRSIKLKRFSQFVTPEIMRTTRCNSPSLLNLSLSPSKQKQSMNRKKRNIINKNNSGFVTNNIETGKLFQNWYFLVTHEKDQNSNDVNIELNNCGNIDTSACTKEYIEELIIELGGQVIEVPVRGLIECYRRKECQIILLVLGQSYQTIKFMMCLAVGNIPIVRAQWLQECLNSLSILSYDNFLLPRGTDENNTDISQTLNGDEEVAIFENKKIWIVTDSIPTFGSKWKKVLEIAGADVSLMDTSNFSSDICVRNCHFAVIERGGVTENCLKYLKEREIRVVDIRYIIDCLVKNTLLDVNTFLE